MVRERGAGAGGGRWEERAHVVELRHVHAVHGHLEETGVDCTSKGIVGGTGIVVVVVVAIGEGHGHGHGVCWLLLLVLLLLLLKVVVGWELQLWLLLRDLLAKHGLLLCLK